ncbi:hypothetical protein RvY_04697 [Ramazzottius varieornatus]|uniref:Uncharacterized protein n=1 Tax=Ramazzottius varieornatus TaxID=947166 RepID=A0A1D1USI6_RAMVA|nr:hypothetical protein RvY_04697 [Ramazzottius varieornatus]
MHCRPTFYRLHYFRGDCIVVCWMVTLSTHDALKHKGGGMSASAFVRLPRLRVRNSHPSLEAAVELLPADDATVRPVGIGDVSVQVDALLGLPLTTRAFQIPYTGRDSGSHFSTLLKEGEYFDHLENFSCLSRTKLNGTRTLFSNFLENCPGVSSGDYFVSKIRLGYWTDSSFLQFLTTVMLTTPRKN